MTTVMSLLLFSAGFLVMFISTVVQCCNDFVNVDEGIIVSRHAYCDTGLVYRYCLIEH